MPSVAIVATGPSAAGLTGVEFSPHVGVIAVNGAADVLTRFDYWFTLDPSADNLRRIENKNLFVPYFAAVLPDRVLPHPHAIKLERVETLADDSKFLHPDARRFRCTYGLQEDPGKISTGNSAYGALNLAYHLGASRVALFGVDGTQEERTSGGCPRSSLDFLPELFASAVPQLEARGILVVNGSPYSRVDCFPHMPREEAMAWLNG